MLEKKIRECISFLVVNGKDLSISNIQAQSHCSIQDIMSVLNKLNIPFDEEDKSFASIDDTSNNLEFKVAVKQNEQSNQTMKTAVDATVYQMQNTFRDLANQLSVSLVGVAQNEINSVQKAADLRSKEIDELMFERNHELQVVRNSLLEANQQNIEHEKCIDLMNTQLVIAQEEHEINISTMQNNLKSVQIKYEQSKSVMEEELKDAQYTTTIVHQELESLQELIESLHNKIKTQESSISKKEEELSILNSESVNVFKKIHRSEKENEFLTKKFKSTQKELLQAENVINELYGDNILNNEMLEKLGYQKHHRNLGPESLTNKLFKNKQ